MIYCYRCQREGCGTVLELALPVSKAKFRPTCYDCGEKMSRDWTREHETQSPTGTWPMKCEALAVHPLDAKSAQESAKKRGIHTDFTKSGEPVFTSPGHRKRYCESYGYFAKNAGYGDPVPGPQSQRRR
jgi:hypothetical protein